MKPRLLHCPLEPYKARYTEFLVHWERRAFNKYFDVSQVDIPQSANWTNLNINTGEVLDAVARPVWAMGQMIELLKKAPNIGRVWFSDFFHPGVEALPYSRSDYRAYSFLWAQTFDKYDFTTRFFNWMRPWEISALNIYSRVFVASELLADLIVTATSISNISVVGLPFNSKLVANNLGEATLAEERIWDCVYTSRWDTEKNPGLFLDLVESEPELKFVVCTGHPELRGTDEAAIKRAKVLQGENRLRIFTNCSKSGYYGILADAKVQFNSALQDWVSFTLLEALTFGCLPLYPDFRSFPETLFHQPDFLYRPGDLENAQTKLKALLEETPKQYQELRNEVLDYHDGTLNRIAQIIAQE